MLLMITNTCFMGCPHCLQCSSEEPQHMDDNTFEKALGFMKKSGALTVLVSGGEPTTHPKWSEYVKRILNEKNFISVSLLSNGAWLGDKSETEKEIVDLLSGHDNFFVQLTSINGLYREHERTEREVSRFFNANRNAINGIENRVSFETEPLLHMVELGRAKENEKFAKEARADSARTASCFSAALVSAQTGFANAISILEMKGKFCRPLIDWKGNLHWSESWLCPSFASVFDSFDDIAAKAHEWRPCCQCAGIKKVFESTNPIYAAARRILGI